MSKCGVFTGPYFPEFGLNTGKYGPEKSSYLDSFHTVFYLIGQKEMIMNNSESARIMEAVAQ